MFCILNKGYTVCAKFSFDLDCLFPVGEVLSHSLFARRIQHTLPLLFSRILRVDLTDQRAAAKVLMFPSAALRPRHVNRRQEPRTLPPAIITASSLCARKMAAASSS